MAEQQTRTRTHLYEIDMVRAVTVLAVVGVHVGAFTIILTHDPLTTQLQNAAVNALHFTREIFMSLTGFVLFYTYGNRPFSAKSFWRKRGIGVFLPYVIWSIFYDVVRKPPLAPAPWLERLVVDILTGGASFQLYYILLTLEFYLALPWFLKVIAWGGKRPWALLGVSFALQFVMLVVDYRYLQTGAVTKTAFGYYFNLAQERLLPLYQLYMVIGGVAALYMRQLREFTLRNGALVVGGLALGLALLWGNEIYQVNIAHGSMTYALSVFQPAMAIYGPATALFLYWIAYNWSAKRAPQPPRWSRFWVLISNISFGIYLIHAYILDVIMDNLAPRLPWYWPQPLKVVLVWLLTVGITTLICSVLLYTPVLSRLIGRPSPLRRDIGVGLRISQFTEQLGIETHQIGRRLHRGGILARDVREREVGETPVAQVRSDDTSPLMPAQQR